MDSHQDTKCASALILHFPASRNVKNKFILFISHLDCSTFVIAPWMAKTYVLTVCLDYQLVGIAIQEYKIS